MGSIRCVGWEKLERDLVARTFALIEPVQYALQQVSCSYGTIPNAPNYYKTDRNISLGYNGVDWLHSLQKISTGHCGTNFCINCSSSSCFAPSFMLLRNDPKCTQTLHQNLSLGSNGVDQLHSLQKIQCDIMARTFVLIEPVQYGLKQVSCSYGTIPNAPKYYETHRNISLGSNG